MFFDGWTNVQDKQLFFRVMLNIRSFALRFCFLVMSAIKTDAKEIFWLFPDEKLDILQEKGNLYFFRTRENELFPNIPGSFILLPCKSPSWLLIQLN